MGEPDDDELLRAIIENDREAWALLVRRHAGRLWAIARAQGLDRDRASDAVQTTWIKLIDNAPKIRQAESLAGWLARVVRNEAITVGKAVSREGPGAVIQTVLEHNPDPVMADSGLLLRERADEVRAALARLDPASRELVHLLFADCPLSYSEIAAATGMPIGSIGPTRARCLDKLRRELER